MAQTPKSQSDKEEASYASSLDADQKQRQYYYDDAHGYETFIDDETEDDEADDIVTAESGGNE